MALHVPRAPGLSQMLKDGAKHYSGVEEAVLRNIVACKELAQKTRSAYGPFGQNKMVINHISKLFVTNDAATIIRELEVEHPAAKLLVMGSQQQEQEAGDATNFVLIFAGALLDHAESLIRMGLSVKEVIGGYEQALKKSMEILPELVVDKVKDLSQKAQVLPLIRSSIMSKQYGNEDFLSEIIVDACLNILPEKSTFNVDSIRISKIAGQGVHNTSIVQGMVFKRQVEGDVNKSSGCKVAVYSCPLDLMQTETKGTVLIKSAQELLDYSTGEEKQVEEHIKSIADSGCSVIVAGGKVGELYLHYCNQYKLMVVRLMSKFDLRRLCKAIGATPLPRITVPTGEEMGHCDLVYTDEVGDTPVIIFKQEREESAISTIVIRGATDNIMDDIERAVDDGVNTFKMITRDGRYLAGAGATEMELAKKISSFGEICPGLEQYAIGKFAESLEALPRALAENCGVKATEVVSKLYAAHQGDQKYAGVDVEAGVPAVCNAVENNIFDLFLTKHWALKFATRAACTVLSVDQIIMAKAAGGPKPKENKDWDED
ncbi:hypothetical protein CAPTEDRAFT_170370 [Capitella teleta]|uniref:T-complex protein 1 subunit theta n=1 Tax=Capitella teleta TaxID=283909 RepID=R7URY8_CAPTE|nr:hypothetical protein CAPTEDRAFT_170370 [Capitella teleta]|eukprot:ELU09284.1 hypothetical protein CAPTEDRAFT_170370 [Capitella teleta]